MADFFSFLCFPIFYNVNVVNVNVNVNVNVIVVNVLRIGICC